jgi:hypothetical protein
VLFAVNPIDFAIFTLEKGGNRCFLAFYKMIQARFLPSYPVILPVLASKKEKIIDY